MCNTSRPSLQARALAPAVPAEALSRAAAAAAALSAIRADTAKALASALNGKALGGITDSTAGAISGSFPTDPITAFIEAGRNSTVRLSNNRDVAETTKLCQTCTMHAPEVVH